MPNHIIIIGGGAYGTALASQLSQNTDNEITIWVRNPEVAGEINEQHTNNRYFPGRRLNHRIRATNDYEIFSSADLVLFSIPSFAIEKTITYFQPYLKPESVIVNMAKGILESGQTIVSFISEKLGRDDIITWKGASFSTEMFNNSPSLLTLGYVNIRQLSLIQQITIGTNIFTDFTTDIKGVELLSALKNVYAILIGYIDARFNSSNTRFMVFTKALGEMRLLLTTLGGRKETLFLSCGIGDTALTALNDLSRNRTLGLLLGKGFFNAQSESNSVVLEGVTTIRLIDRIVDEGLKKRLPLFSELAAVLVTHEKEELELDFSKLFNRAFTTVLTYGTFDLIHYGHLELLRRAKSFGDRLIVGLSTDEFNQEKGKVCEMSFKKRKEYLESLGYVDLVIPEANWEQKVKDIQDNRVDVFVMGDDWKGKFDFLETYCEVVYLPRTAGISTSDMKKILRNKN